MLAFFTGLSIDPINVPTFVIISFWGLFALIENRKQIKENFNKVLAWLGMYSTYILALLFYFIRPIHHVPNYKEAGNLVEYTTMYFNQYVNEYLNVFLKEYSIFIIPIVCLVILFFIFLRKKLQCKRGFLFICTNLIILLVFYFLLFYLGFIDRTDLFFAIYYGKWISLYKTTTYFFLLLSFGLFIDSITLNNKISNTIKIIVCILTIIIFHNVLIANNVENIKNTQKEMKELRQAAYSIEKITINTNKKEKIILPKEYEKYTHSLFINEGTCSFFQYVKNVHPNTKLFDYKLSENKDVNNKLNSEEESSIIKFQNLLTEKMYRHKKVIENCY